MVRSAFEYECASDNILDKRPYFFNWLRFRRVRGVEDVKELPSTFIEQVLDLGSLKFGMLGKLRTKTVQKLGGFGSGRTTTKFPRVCYKFNIFTFSPFPLD